MSPRAFLCVALLAAPVATCQGLSTLLVAPGEPVASSAITGTGASVFFISAFSPAGVPGQTYNVYTANVDGSGFRQLTNAISTAVDLGGVDSMSLTSDGKWLGYAVNTGANAGEIHLLNVNLAPAAGSDRTLFVQPACGPESSTCSGCAGTCLQTPHISDDGSTILFTDPGAAAFFVVKSDGSAPVPLPIYSGALAQSSKRVISSAGRVVFTSAQPSSSTASGIVQVYLMNLDGSHLQQVTAFTDASMQPQEATISADGTTIAFTVQVPSSQPFFEMPETLATLYTIRSDGSLLSPRAVGAISAPSLSANGTLLSYVNGGQAQLLWLFTGAQPIALTHLQDSVVGDATISDDGTRVALTVGSQELLAICAVYSPGDLPPPDCIPATTVISTAAVYTVATESGAVTTAYAPRYVAPPFQPVAGSLATSYGYNIISDTTLSASTLPLPNSLGGISLTLNGEALPLLSTSPWSITYQIPPDAAPAPDVFQAKFPDGSESTAQTATVLAVLPSPIYASVTTIIEPSIFHGNTSTLVDSTHPAVAGEVLVMYASGLGPTNPTVPAGTAAPANPPAMTVNQPQVILGLTSAHVQFSGLAPGMVGLYQINFVVPSGLAGPQALSVAVTGQSATFGPIYIQ
jgi:uncharacterized protein (TIGR03437 family)